MKHTTSFHMFSLSLAIFSMFFGAGNIIYPIMVGLETTSHPFIGIASFLLTAICLPLLGLIGMIIFDGNFEAFFGRLGENTGKIVVACCMIIIGPLIAMPRIATLSYTMIAPFLPLSFLQQETYLSSALFALTFFTVTFLCTIKENKIVDLLGNVISPLLLGSLAIIIIKGWFTPIESVTGTLSAYGAFSKSILRGYETLDLLGALFFAFVILTLIKKTFNQPEYTDKKRAMLVLRAGFFGLGLLSVVYIGLSTLGAFYGHLLPAHLHAGQVFREIALIVLGPRGTIVISLAVLMACLSTAIALAAVCAEYVHTLLHNKISYVAALALTLAACMPLSIAGLGKVLALTGGPITFVGYPVLIALTLCNICYKLFGFKPVKTPVALTGIIATIIYCGLL